MAMLEPERDTRAPAGASKSVRSNRTDSQRASDVDSIVAKRVEAWRQHRGLWPTGLILVAALAATFAVWRLVARDARSDAHREFDALTQNAATELREAMNTHQQVLRGAAGVFHSMGHVSREAWRTYVGSLDIEKNYRGIQGIGFAAALRPPETADLVARIHAEGRPDYTIRPEGSRSLHGPIVYLEPEDSRNRSALGYDMFSEPVRRAAMEAARDTGEAKVSGKVAFDGETLGTGARDVQPGVLLFVPLYQPGPRLETADDRRAILRGWVFAPLRMNNFVRAALARTIGPEARTVRFEIFDGAEVAEAGRLYDSGSAVQPGEVPHQSQLSAALPVDVFGHTWTIKASSLPAFETDVASLTPIGVVFSGTLISLLMAAVAWTVNRRQMEATEAAASLSAELAGRRRAEEALRESEGRLRRMADNAPVMVWMSEPDGRCTFRSKSWYQFTGQAPMAGLDFGWADAVHPDDRDQAQRAFRAANARREPFRQEYRLRDRDGGYRWAIDAATPNIAADGQFLGYIGSVVDIDERKRAEAANARVASIVQAAHDAIVGVGLDGTIESWNAAGEQLFGYSVAEAVGHPIAMLVPPELSEEQRKLFSRVRKGAKVGPVEARLLRKDGTPVDVRLALAPIRSANGDVTGVSEAFQDIGERLRAEKALRENEARLRHIASASPSILWSAGPDGVVNWVSDRWYRYTGVPSEAGPRDWAEFVHPDDRGRWRSACDGALHGGSAYEVEVRCRRHDGQYRWFITRGTPQRDDSGRIVAWFGAITDIDDMKRAEQAVRQSESRFRTVFNQQFQFMAILSPEGMVRACNDTFFAATGVGKEVVLGKYFWDTPWWAGSPDERRWWQAAVEGAVDSGGSITGEVVLANADGSKCQAEFAVTGVRDETGRVMDVIAEGRDITHRKRWEEQQTLLTKELAHRIKNSMAVIQSIARQTLRDAPKPFAEAFTGRVQALAAAHDILLETGWLAANLKDLATRQLAVVPGRIKLAGPDVTLPPILATSLGLVLHELVTNASKYGALSAPQGAVEFSWELVGDGGQRRVVLTWKERDGPPVTPPNHEGFGSTLIERSLPGATVERRFEPGGLECTIDLPLP